MTPPQPRWINALTKALSLPENKGQNVYQIATVENGIPRVRTQVHRDIIYPEGCPHLPILLTTTDARSPKVSQITATPRVEVAWWLQGSQDQFRIAGPVRFDRPGAGSPDDPGRGGPFLALRRMDQQNFDWEAKRRAVFDTMSAHMRASWCRPPPGSTMSAYADAKKWPATVPSLGEAESDEDRTNQEQALGNFALVLIEAEEVDWVQLGVIPNQRTKFVRQEDGSWKEEIIVP
ncbi:hypothetical protein CERSUDRAFT_126726 [Gelatoporia subvermispora B]|uniref:Pyridoxamine 5'-phosphate oxidase Alr4036 family FMN-binding domain-containing protein n=1 Tax=Ceriporiopsis subvermispora (strain B) TaxID=914234 RepID=M2Q711_CERS8|nr:hypothetical protein CERSUDRAFT_126726 [Gelatoporia subvermispora B]